MKSRFFASLLGLLSLASIVRAADWAPDSLVGYKAIVVISGGSGYFANLGGYRLTVGTTSATVTPLSPNVVSQTFTYTYAKLTTTTGRVTATDATNGITVVQNIAFTSATSATFSLTSTVGSQSGTFVLEGTPSSSNRLVNISSRANIQSGDNLLIAGFVITGSSPKSVLIRGVGPALAGVLSGYLLDPMLELYDSTGVLLATNDDWSPTTIGTAFAQVGAGAWASGSKDAALLVTLPPGIYTAHVKGKNNTTGVGLAEVFEMP